MTSIDGRERLLYQTDRRIERLEATLKAAETGEPKGAWKRRRIEKLKALLGVERVYRSQTANELAAAVKAQIAALHFKAGQSPPSVTATQGWLGMGPGAIDHHPTVTQAQTDAPLDAKPQLTPINAQKEVPGEDDAAQSQSSPIAAAGAWSGMGSGE